VQSKSGRIRCVKHWETTFAIFAAYEYEMKLKAEKEQKPRKSVPQF